MNLQTTKPRAKLVRPVFPRHHSPYWIVALGELTTCHYVLDMALEALHRERIRRQLAPRSKGWIAS